MERLKGKANYMETMPLETSEEALFCGLLETAEPEEQELKEIYGDPYRHLDEL